MSWVVSVAEAGCITIGVSEVSEKQKHFFIRKHYRYAFLASSGAKASCKW